MLRVESGPAGTVTYYRREECPCCEKSVYSYDMKNGTESMTFYMRDGDIKTVSRKMRKSSRDKKYIPLCSVYNDQYGITVSYDGSRFFTSRWEGGVYCFDSGDFTEVWKSNIGRVRQIFTLKDCGRIFCERDGFGLVSLDMSSGMGTENMTGTSSRFYRLDEETFITGEKRGYYYICRFDSLSEICRIKRTDILPDSKWVIRNIWQEGSILRFDCFVNLGEETVFEYSLK